MKTCAIVDKPPRTNVAALTCGYLHAATCPSCGEWLCYRHSRPKTVSDARAGRLTCAGCGHTWDPRTTAVSA